MSGEQWDMDQAAVLLRLIRGQSDRDAQLTIAGALRAERKQTEDAYEAIGPWRP